MPRCHVLIAMCKTRKTACLKGLSCILLASVCSSAIEAAEDQKQRHFPENFYSEVIPRILGVSPKRNQLVGNVAEQPTYWVKLAKENEADGKYSSAESCYLKAIAILQKMSDSKIASALRMEDLARLYGRQRKFMEAVRWQQRAVEVYGKEESAYYAGMLRDLARYHKELGEYERAEALLIEGIEVNRRVGGMVDFKILRADVSLALGKRAKAKELYRKILGIHGSNDSTDRGSSQGGLPEIIKSDSLLDTKKMVNNAWLHRYLKDYSKASMQCEHLYSSLKLRLPASAPQYGVMMYEANVLLGTCYWRQGMMPEAEEAYSRALLIHNPELLGF